MIEIPTKTHSFEIYLDPDDSAFDDFDTWVEDQKQRLEAAKLTIIEINGACFSGFYNPEQADLSIFET